MDYPSNPTVGLVGGKFSDGDPGLGIAASEVYAPSTNAVFDELIAVIVAGGGAPAEATLTQVRDAINTLISDAVAAAVPLNKYNAAVDPGVANDSSEGYSEGSKWFNITADTVWFCLSAAVGAAVWVNATLELDDLGTMATQDADAVAITGGSAALADCGVTGAAATVRPLSWKTGANKRWQAYATSDAEAGANAGSDFSLDAFSDAGAFNFSALTINRASGAAVFHGTLQPGSARWRKQNIRDFSPSLDELATIPLRAFEWTDDGRPGLGAVADEVATVFEPLTTPSTDPGHQGEPGSVDYGVLGFIYGRRLLDEVLDLRRRLTRAESTLATLAERG